MDGAGAGAGAAFCLRGCEGGKVGCDVGIFFFQVLGGLKNRGYQWAERVLEEDLGILLDPRR